MCVMALDVSGIDILVAGPTDFFLIGELHLNHILFGISILW